MISTFPAIPLGPLHYRNMAKGNFDAVMPPLPFELNREIIWWEQNSMSSKRDIIIPQINCFITTDARSLEWGATDGKISAGGRWKASENFHKGSIFCRSSIIADMAYISTLEYTVTIPLQLLISITKVESNQCYVIN